MKLLKNNPKFQWIGKGIPHQTRGNKKRHVAFSIGDLKINVGDFVLVRNDDALDPEDVITSYVAQVKDLFDSGEKLDPYQAQVQWFSKIHELPAYAMKSVIDTSYDNEIVLDKRSSWHDMIDAETVFQKCEVLFQEPNFSVESVLVEYYDHPFPVFFCRYVFTGTSLISVMKGSYKQLLSRTLSSFNAPDGETCMKDFIPHSREKEPDSLDFRKSSECATVNGFNHHAEKNKNSVSKKDKSVKKRNLLRSSTYCTIPVGDSKYPKVVIKKIDDRVLDNENGNVRIFVADSSVDKVTDALVEKLSLNKTAECNSSQEKRPIIHSLSSKIEISEPQTKNEFVSKITNGDSIVESEVMKTPKSRRSIVGCHKFLDDLSCRTLRSSPKKTPVIVNTTESSTPSKKVKLENVSLRRSGRKVKCVNYSERECRIEYDRKVTVSKTPQSKKKLHFVSSNCSDDSDNSNFSPAEESSDESSLSGVSLSDNIESPNSNKLKHFSKRKKSPRKSLSSRKSLSKKVVSLSIPERKTPLKTPQNSLEESRQRLHVSAVPDSLPCREDEYSDIYSFVKGCLFAKTGGCMYISGVPGTGKTATVHEVLRNLEKEKELGEVPIFNFVEVNGMWMTDPYQCYVQIFKALTGKSIAPQQAADLLEKRFTEAGPKKDAVVLLVDELDRLWTRKQTVMYNIFDWPTKKNSKLVVLAIANTMDLPERMMMNRISSRLGLTRRTFQPYNFKQLQEIIMSRIQELKVFDPDAVQLVARKVAAVSGDARRALDICRFAAEIVKVGSLSKKSQKVLVGMEHVDAALQQMFSSPVISAIRSSSKLAKLFFQCVLSEFNRSGLEETTLMKVHEQVVAVCRFEGFRTPSYSEISRICTDLAASHLILIDNFKNDLYMKIRLNVSSDDVTYALSKH